MTWRHPFGLKESIHRLNSLKHASDDCDSNDMERVVMHRCSVVVIVGQDNRNTVSNVSLGESKHPRHQHDKRNIAFDSALTFGVFFFTRISIHPSNHSAPLPKHRHNRSPPHTNTPRHGPIARRNRRRAIMVAARRMLAHVLGSRYGRRRVAVRRV